MDSERRNENKIGTHKIAEEKAENYAYELQYGRRPDGGVKVEAYETITDAEVYEEEKARLNKVDAVAKPFGLGGVALW